MSLLTCSLRNLRARRFGRNLAPHECPRTVRVAAVQASPAVLADCDLGEIVRESPTLDVSGHCARPGLFRLQFRLGRPDTA